VVPGPRTGASSKTTFLRALGAVLGDYAVTIDAEGILAQRYSGGPTPELSKLEGCRLAVIEEIPRGRKPAEGVVKNMTGGSTMSTNNEYERSRTWVPQFVLMIGANDRPVIRAEDSGAWRRVREVPFTHVFPDAEQDPTLKDTREGLGVGAGPAILGVGRRGVPGLAD
jgi:putative DNA primase/helicase